MQNMNIALTDDQKRFVHDAAEREGFSSVSEYLRQLIREEQRREEMAALEQSLLEVLRQPTTSMEAEDWQAVRQRGANPLPRQSRFGPHGRHGEEESGEKKE